MNVNHIGIDGWSPLHRACSNLPYRPQFIVVEALLRFGARVDEEWEGDQWANARRVRAQVIETMGGPEGVQQAFSAWASMNLGRNTKAARSQFFDTVAFQHIAAALFQ